MVQHRLIIAEICPQSIIFQGTFAPNRGAARGGECQPGDVHTSLPCSCAFKGPRTTVHLTPVRVPTIRCRGEDHSTSDVFRPTLKARIFSFALQHSFSSVIRTCAIQARSSASISTNRAAFFFHTHCSSPVLITMFAFIHWSKQASKRAADEALQTNHKKKPKTVDEVGKAQSSGKTLQGMSDDSVARDGPTEFHDQQGDTVLQLWPTSPQKKSAT